MWNIAEIQIGDTSEIFNFSEALTFPKIMKRTSEYAKVNTESSTDIGVSKARTSLSLPRRAATVCMFIYTLLEAQARDSDFLEFVIYL